MNGENLCDSGIGIWYNLQKRCHMEIAERELGGALNAVTLLRVP